MNFVYPLSFLEFLVGWIYIDPSQILSLSLLSDSNQRPRDYKSRALANCAKEASG